ncbi:AzlD domain-containing protein [Halobacteriovorax sp.]|uniref:AzlD domain-containing protein n=1 Tax=Halobacteriovorax sp. TaxID=2020862 RepID=UPI003563549E
MKYEGIWFVIIGLGLGTFIIRSTFIYLSSRIEISERFKEILSLIPAAIFPALVVPMTFYHKGANELLFNKERFIVLIIASIICYRLKSVFITIVSGLIILYILS